MTIAPGAPTDPHARSVIDRALSILASFHGVGDGQTLSEIARAAGLPIATCYRLVKRLTEWGALERDADGRYRIGLRLWEIASLAPRSVGLQRVARPYLQDLYETTGHPSHLAIREGTELVSIERFESPRRQGRPPVVGVRYPLHATASGQVLLAHASEALQQEVLSGEFQVFTGRTYRDRATLERVLADIRRAGYAVSDRQIDNVYTGFSAPIMGADGTVVAAVALSMKATDGHADHMVHVVRLTASAISRAIRAAAAAGHPA